MDEKTKNLTAVRKRQQIQKAQRTMLSWVAVASAIVIICVVLGVNFVQTIIYNNKVIGAKNDTNKILKDDIAKITTLKENVDKLQTDENLNKLKADPNDTASQVVIDALPTSDDRTALASSLQEKVLSQSGVAIDQVTVTDVGTVDSSTTGPAGNSAGVSAQTINFTFTISGSYDSITKAIQDIERTIRPITIDSMTLQGTSNQLQATVAATTYYSPSIDFELGSKEVQP